MSLLTVDGDPNDLAKSGPDAVVGLAHVMADIGIARVQHIQRSVLLYLQVRTRDDRALRWQTNTQSGGLANEGPYRRGIDRANQVIAYPRAELLPLGLALARDCRRCGLVARLRPDDPRRREPAGGAVDAGRGAAHQVRVRGLDGPFGRHLIGL